MNTKACPICPSCNGRKFKIVARHEDGYVLVECLRCSTRILV